MVAVPILVLSLASIISTAFPRFRKLQQATDGINRTLQENFIGIRVVKIIRTWNIWEEKIR